MNRHDRPQAGKPPIVLSVRFPDEDDDVPPAQMQEIEEALLSLTRAALAQGRQLVLPADPVAAPVVAQTAAEYADDLGMEAIEVPPPLVHVLTEGRDDHLVEALSALDHVGLARFPDLRQERRMRDRLTVEMLAEFHPAAGVVFGGASESLDDLKVLTAREIPQYVVGTALAGPLAERREFLGNDITEDWLVETDWGAAEADVVPGEWSVPYPYVMQRLVERLGGE